MIPEDCYSCKSVTGIRAVDFYGNFFMNNTTDVQLACVDPETCVAVDIKHDDKLDEREGAYIQVQ
jgi:protein transport protein SEC24